MGSATLAFTESNFQDEVLGAAEPVLVDFTATWCGPCQRLAPVIDTLAESYSGRVKIGKVDVDENQSLAEKFGVASVPTVLVFKAGEVVDIIRGYNPESVLSNKLDSVLNGG